MGQLTEQAKSRYALEDSNFIEKQARVLANSGLSKDKFKVLLVKVDKWFNESTQQNQNVYMQTIVCDDNAKDFRRNGS